MVVCSRCVELWSKMPAVHNLFSFWEQTAGGIKFWSVTLTVKHHLNCVIANSEVKYLGQKILSRCTHTYTHRGCRGWTGTAVWIGLLGYAGIEDKNTLNVNVAILYWTRCFTGSQWSYWRSGLALVWPPHWQTALAKLFCAHCSVFRVAAGVLYSMTLQ